ncbi:uncharacterized protein LOC101850169 [Aplysia californica]|uniref:Uncharacterized protein LOC101850169 n=1 Tax=Aplysia californica TaxID=6500 RepID=A0ABM0ZZT3_APLCA|nr:uncharacterized protein LOC101850169 [Aplysia californica]
MALFTYNLMMPFCGNRHMNLVVAVWLVGLFFEQLYLAVVKRWHFGRVSIVANVRYMLVMLVTLALIVVFRILYWPVLPFFIVKIFLCFSLIYFFYYAMGYFFPVSKTLGPMLINITVMMRRDLVKWLRIWSMTLISGAVAVHAVLYPAAPFNLNTLWSAFIRGVFALFTTDISDLDTDDPVCACLYHETGEKGCRAPEQVGSEVLKKIERCPYQSHGGYVITLQYIFITKLIFGTLIFAICR